MSHPSPTRAFLGKPASRRECSIKAGPQSVIRWIAINNHVVRDYYETKCTSTNNMTSRMKQGRHTYACKKSMERMPKSTDNENGKWYAIQNQSWKQILTPQIQSVSILFLGVINWNCMKLFKQANTITLDDFSTRISHIFLTHNSRNMLP